MVTYPTKSNSRGRAVNHISPGLQPSRGASKVLNLLASDREHVALRLHHLVQHVCPCLHHLPAFGEAGRMVIGGLALVLLGMRELSFNQLRWKPDFVQHGARGRSEAVR